VECAAPAGRRPRDASASPLYLAVLDHLETYLSERSRAKDDPSGPAAEFSLRAFLQCGIPRFGLARFRCKCGESRFVAFSCKRRLACPSCDAKRAVVESSHALDELLPDVPYRQWVLILPKRLRYFVHRDPRLAGEIASIFARTLTVYYRKKSAAPRAAAPAQFHALQRFGSAINLHLHDHAVVSDGCFTLEAGKLKFYPARPPGVLDIAKLLEILRRRIFRRMLRLGAVPASSIREMLTWPHSGFSLDAGTRIESGDRDALRRLLLYVLRPALSLKKLTYKPELNLVRYQPSKTNGGPSYHEWTGVEFVRRMAALIPPPRKHVVRYYGALGPCSPLRSAVNCATRGKATSAELEAGYAVTLLGRAAREAGKAAKKAASAARKSWAACMRKVFEVDPVLCAKCGGEMKLVAVILDDGELDRILAHQGWPTEFPKTKPSRAPPARGSSADEEGQLDARVDKWDGRDEPSGDQPA
jgi:Zn-finger nucleic acid-binding protein